MSSDSLHDRGKALENIFFADQDQKLLEKMKEQMQKSEGLKSLAQATGIQENSVLEHLLAQNITSETLASVALIPLVAVAWADQQMEEKEKAAILKAVTSCGITEDQASYALVSHWLESQPGADLLATWKEYVSELKSNLDEAAFAQLKANVVQRAQQVAEAAGGFLGIGNKVSSEEQAVLDELTAAFN